MPKSNSKYIDMYFTKFGHMMLQLRPSWEFIFLLLNGMFFNMKDVHTNVNYISMQLNEKNSSPIVFYKILYKTMKKDFKNSVKMKISILKLKFGRLEWDCMRIECK